MPRAKKSSARPALKARLRGVKLFLCDVDGILTDTSVFIGGPQEIKRYNIQDGLGLMLLRRCNIPVGWVSNRPSSATTMRADELKIDFLVQLKGSKVAAVEEILAQTKLAWNQVCYMGDDVVDVGVLKRAGLAVCVPNGRPEAKAAAHYTTKAGGGHGAVREVVDMILQAQGHWDGIMAKYAE